MTDFEKAFNDCLTELEKAGVAWAEARAMAEQLEEIKKSVLAQEILKQDPKLSYGEKEARGRNSDVFRLHLKGLAEARKEYHRTSVFYEKAKERSQHMRSLCSLQNTQIRNFNG